MSTNDGTAAYALQPETVRSLFAGEMPAAVGTRDVHIGSRIRELSKSARALRGKYAAAWWLKETYLEMADALQGIADELETLWQSGERTLSAASYAKIANTWQEVLNGRQQVRCLRQTIAQREKQIADVERQTNDALKGIK